MIITDVVIADFALITFVGVVVVVVVVIFALVVIPSRDPSNPSTRQQQ